MKFRVERTEDVPLEFTGELLVDVDSKDDRPRWQEIRIYRTDSGKYVTEVVGRSSVPGERTFITVQVHDDPADVRIGLYRKQNGRRYLSDLAFEALEGAAEVDPALKQTLVERL